MSLTQFSNYSSAILYLQILWGTVLVKLLRVTSYASQKKKKNLAAEQEMKCKEDCPEYLRNNKARVKASWKLIGALRSADKIKTFMQYFC